MKFLLHFLICLAGILPSMPVWALHPDVPPERYIIESWTGDRQPAFSTVRAVIEGGDGYMWFCTQEGLIRFDGLNFTVLNRRNTAALAIDNFFGLRAARDGSLWFFGLGNRLYRFRGGTFTAHPLQGQNQSVILSRMWLDDNGDCWLMTINDGLLCIPGGPENSDRAARVFTTRDGLPDNRISCLMRDRRGLLWAGSEYGPLSVWRNGRFEPFVPRSGTMPGDVVSMVEDRSGDIWLGTRSNGLFRLRDGAVQSYREADGLPGNFVQTIQQDRDGNLWLSIWGKGLARFHSGRFTLFSTADGLPSNNILTIYEDRGGSLWLGTYDGGVARLRDNRFINYTEKQGVLSNMPTAVVQDGTGAMWIATQSGGLNRFHNGEIRSWRSLGGVPLDSISSLAADAAGLWIGTRSNGLVYLKGEEAIPLTRRDGLLSNGISGLSFDRRGRLWVAGDAGVNVVYDGRPQVAYNAVNGLGGNAAYLAYEDRRGNMWVALASKGIVCIGQGGCRSFSAADGLSARDVMVFYEDRQGYLWMGSYGAGLYVRHNDRFTTLGAAQGIPDDYIYSIQEDDRGNLWMGGKKGIFVVPLAELQACVSGQRQRVRPISFGKEDGMPSAICVGRGFPASWKSRDGRFWFLTSRGVASIDPGSVVPVRTPPPVFIEEVRVDEQPVSMQSPLRVRAGSRKFSFRFTALDFVSPARLQFRYRLEGFDPDWIDEGEKRTVNYTNLPPGRYTFRVIAGNRDGAWNESGASFTFTLTSHFYQTVYFFLFLAALLAAVLYGGYRLRLRRLYMQSRKLERLVEQRTDEYRREKEKTEMALERVEITSRRLAAMNRELTLTNEELQRVSQSKSDLLRLVAHDLRNPLQSIYGFSQLLQKKNADNPAVVPIADKIVRGAEEMRRLIDEILDMAVIESGKLVLRYQKVDLAELLQQAMGSYMLPAEKKGQRIFIEAEADCLADVDSGRLLEVLDNLLSNAVKYSPQDCRIWLAVHRENGNVRISIRDEGPGLSDRDKANMFRKFQRLSARPTGGESAIGLGLAIAKMLVELMGGAIWAESPGPGKGTTFIVELPAAQ